MTMLLFCFLNVIVKKHSPFVQNKYKKRYGLNGLHVLVARKEYPLVRGPRVPSPAAAFSYCWAWCRSVFQLRKCFLSQQNWQFVHQRVAVRSVQWDVFTTLFSQKSSPPPRLLFSFSPFSPNPKCWTSGQDSPRVWRPILILHCWYMPARPRCRDSRSTPEKEQVGSWTLFMASPTEGTAVPYTFFSFSDSDQVRQIFLFWFGSLVVPCSSQWFPQAS